MLAHLGSLRLRLLAAMVGTALVGLAAAYFAIGRIESAQEHTKDQAKALLTARAIAAQAAAGAGVDRFRALQAVFPNDQIVVERGGRTIFAGPALTGRPLEGTESAKFAGGRVTVRDHTSPEHASPFALTLVVAAVIALVIGAAIAVATVIAGAIRRPIKRAIATADKLAGGDLSARMGTGGPEEFHRLARAFDGMATRLETADADQRRFLTDVTHEIATPVNTIAGFGLAFADGSLETDEERAEASALIESEARRLESLLSDLRELSRLDIAEASRAEAIELDAFCHELATRFAPAARAGAVDVRVDAPSATVTADRRLLETVIGNLLSNAIRYTPPGGDVTLSARRRRQRLVVTVRDTGIGIAPEEQERIFHRLYRVDAARTRATGGSGLGLAIAERAAQTLGARIELDSALGAGSEFRVILPIARQQQGGSDGSPLLRAST